MAELTHLDADGHARMVDVGGKAETRRIAIASGRITMRAEALAAIRNGNAPKGDVLAAARIAGIMAAKQTSALIPLCHPLLIDAVTVDFAFEAEGLRATASVAISGKTTSVALLTIYDMAKALDKAMVITDIHLIEKRGGKSGDWFAPGRTPAA